MTCYSPVTSDALDVIMLMKQKEHLILEALEYANGTYSYDDFVEFVLTGKLHWIDLPNSFLAVEVKKFPQAKIMNIALGGGSLEEIKAYMPNVMEAARLAGCSRLMVNGRRGWVRAFRELGWKEQYTAVAVDLTGAKR